MQADHDRLRPGSTAQAMTAFSVRRAAAGRSGSARANPPMLDVLRLPTPLPLGQRPQHLRLDLVLTGSNAREATPSPRPLLHDPQRPPERTVGSSVAASSSRSTESDAFAHPAGNATVIPPTFRGSPISTRIDHRTCRVTSAARPTVAPNTATRSDCMTIAGEFSGQVAAGHGSHFTRESPHRRRFTSAAGLQRFVFQNSPAFGGFTMMLVRAHRSFFFAIGCHRRRLLARRGVLDLPRHAGLAGRPDDAPFFSADPELISEEGLKWRRRIYACMGYFALSLAIVLALRSGH